MTESTFQTYTGEETLTHDNSAKFNSENEDANENEKEDDDECLKKLDFRCGETNLQRYQRNKTNNQKTLRCFECYKQNIKV